MPGLTSAQILTGAKGYARNVPAPPPEPPGRWRCTLCPWPRWIDGTYHDWMQHYTTEHQDKD